MAPHCGLPKARKQPGPGKVGPGGKKKRDRGPTRKQKLAMLAYMKKHTKFAQGRINVGNASQKFQAMKQRVADIINSAEPSLPDRDADKWWKTWVSLRNQAKWKAAENRGPSTVRTGGGNDEDTMDPDVSISSSTDGPEPPSERHSTNDEFYDEIMVIMGWHVAHGTGLPDDLADDSGTSGSQSQVSGSVSVLTDADDISGLLGLGQNGGSGTKSDTNDTSELLVTGGSNETNVDTGDNFMMDLDGGSEINQPVTTSTPAKDKSPVGTCSQEKGGEAAPKGVITVDGVDSQAGASQTVFKVATVEEDGTVTETDPIVYLWQLVETLQQQIAELKVEITILKAESTSLEALQKDLENLKLVSEESSLKIAQLEANCCVFNLEDVDESQQ